MLEVRINQSVNNKHKIVHISDSYIDNFSYQNQLLPKVQARMGDDVTVIAPIKVWLEHYTMTEADYNKNQPYYYDGVKIVRLNQNLKFLGCRFTTLKNLYALIEQEQPDILFCHGIQRLDVLTACEYKKNHPDCCVVVDVHSDEFNSATNFLSKFILHKILWRLVARRAEKILDRIYYITPSIKDFIIEMYGLSSGKLAPTYLGADMALINNSENSAIRSSVRKSLGIGNDDFVIVTAGKIDKNKMTHILLEALNLLEFSSVHVVIVGSVDKDYKSTLLDLVDKGSVVHFTGWVESDKINEYFLSSDLGVFPKSQSVLWQTAICCGLPCIFGYYPGGEYLNPAGNAMFLYSSNPRELAQLIDLLISNPRRLEQMKKTAQTEGVMRFNYESIAKEIKAFANDVLSLNKNTL